MSVKPRDSWNMCHAPALSHCIFAQDDGRILQRRTPCDGCAPWRTEYARWSCPKAF